jgi:hypothetical protein
VRNPIRLLIILLFSMSPVSAPAQRILVAGVKQVSACEYAIRPLESDLRTIDFPRDWTIVIACNTITWDNLRRKADALQTNTAFTNLQGRITVINAEIYREMPPLSGTMHRTSKLVLQHEYGHIVCRCSDERRADRAGGLD